jgi:hypothetical protein
MTVLVQPRRAHLNACGWFWAWALVGCAAALGAVTLGVLGLGPAVVAGSWMSAHPAARRSAFGLLSGIAVPLLYVAWLQRAGPGTSCWHTATASGCDHPLNPLPWAVAGVAFFVGGIIAHALRD